MLESWYRTQLSPLHVGGGGGILANAIREKRENVKKNKEKKI
jgi:hypothetical protein